MDDRLTEVERRMLHTLLIVRECLAGNTRLTAASYTNTMALVRDGIVLLENKAGGCASGRHASTCTCTPRTAGKNFDYQKYGRR